MRTFVMTNFEDAPQVVDLPRPEPGPGEVLVRNRASSINGFDLAVAAGMLKGMMEYQFPLTLGKDYAGVVEATGSGANRFAAGDSVLGVIQHPTFMNTGGFAEYVVVPENSFIETIPAGLSMADAGALGLAGTAALVAVEAVGSKSGETVLISGATGGAGALAVQLVAATGATVVATARPGDGADFVLDLGATHVVDYSADVASQMRQLSPDGVDAVIHLAGDGPALAALLATGGRFSSTLGVGSDQIERQDVTASAVMAVSDLTALSRMAAEVASGRLRVPIGASYELDQTGQAFTAFRDGAFGKVAVAIN